MSIEFSPSVPPAGPIAPLKSAISNLRAIVDKDYLGATIRFNIESLANIAEIALVRSLTPSILAATQLNVYPRSLGAVAPLDDRDSSIIGNQVWYWVVLTGFGEFQGNKIGNAPVVSVGPVTVAVRASAAASAVNWMEVSETQGDEEDSVIVNVVCEVPPFVDWSGGIAVYVQNYQGNAANVLVYQDISQQLTFHLKNTGELVIFTVATVNAAGQQSALSAGFNLSLNNVPTKPARLTGLSATEGAGFTQIGFLASPEPTITEYKLYRGAYGGTFSGAAFVASISPTDAPQYSIQDNVINGGAHTYQWYVTAVNEEGESTPSDAIYPAQPWA